MSDDLINRRIMAELAEAMGSDTPVVLATVIGTRRSVPRHAGSKMLVYPDGTISGSIGGGEMEARVKKEARVALADGRPRLVNYELVDPGRGDPGVCGGEINLYLEAYMPASTVYVIGCGHIGAAVIELAHWLGFRVLAYDDREEQTDLPDADVVTSGDFAAALAEAPITESTDVVMVTRNVAVDLGIIPLLVETPARSIGVMGSARRWQTTRKALEDQGIAAEALDRLRAPIGLELNAETPEEIAVSIMSEIVMDRRGGTGEAMSSGSGKPEPA